MSSALDEPARAVRRAAVPVVAAALALALGPAPAPAASSDPRTEEVDFDSQVRPVLATYCFRCHGETRQKGNLRLDVLDPDLVAGPDAHAWHLALEKLNAGEMPPEEQPQPADDERRRLIGWLTDSLAEAARHAQGERRTVMRRLNKAQYTYTLQELLGTTLDYGRALPDDGKSKTGFSNRGAVLQASPLHLDYYRAIARAALDDAIVVGPRPPVTRYRVTFGKGIGAGLVAGSTGGYQSVPLSTDDFAVEVLDADGDPVEGADEAERAALDALRRHVSVGLRGSSQSRFRVVDDGLVLYSALPHVEKVPKAWQGPSPNVKLEMQRSFPEAGDFVMRVRAGRGPLFRSDEEMLLELPDTAPVVAAPSGSSGVAAATPGTIVLSAFESVERQNLVESGPALVPDVLTDASSAAFDVQIPTKGYWQVDLVHPPAAADAMPSVRLGLGALTLDMRPEPTDPASGATRVVTTLGAAHLRARRHRLTVGGPFFVGVSHLALTPLPDDHPLMARLAALDDEASRALQERKTPSIRAFAGTRTDDGMDYLTFGERVEVTAPLGELETVELHGRLENLPVPEPESGDLEVLSGFLLLGLWNDHLVKSPGESGPPLLVRSIEVEAPYLPVWPPEPHARIFGTDRSGDREADARAVVARFAERAFRRPVADDEVDRYMAFWREVEGDYEHWEEGVREVLVAVLCSPHFLFLVEPPVSGGDEGAISPHALACRLSYFLWHSPPDDELRALADAGRLAAELPAQVDRMLDDPRSSRFLRAFAYEWLRLDRHADMTVDPNAHPAYTRFVKEDMAEETHAFLAEVLRRDLSLFTLIESDFAMLNQNLAEFYGIDGVEGASFRAVPVARELGRGGLLSQGAFLSGHSDGSRPHPIKRAVWLKERILGDPPPPPPPNVPDLDPDAPGFEGLTLKEQLERHRDNPSCVDCHRGIDPYGVVFERYDAAGLYRPERDGEPIDVTAELEDGTTITGVDGMKAWILAEQGDAFAAALVEHVWAWALGRDAHFADEEELARILERVQEDGYRLRSVVRHVVTSPSFSRR